MGLVGLTVGIIGKSKHYGSIVDGFAKGFLCVDHSRHGCGINVGVAVGRRSWTVDALGLVKTIGILLCPAI